MAALRDSMTISKAHRMQKRAVRESTKGRDADVVNPRVWNMFTEALEFKGAAIVPFEQELRRLEAATIDFVEGVLPLLRAPLPRVWDRVEATGPLAEPLRASQTHYGHPDISGGNMDDTAVRASLAEFERRLQLHVRRPLGQWVGAVEDVRARIPELDRLRKRLEGRTRKVKAQQKRAEKEERRKAGVRRSGRGFAVGKGRGVKSLLFRCTHPFADEPNGAPASEGGASAGASEGGANDAAAARQDFKRQDLDIKLKERTRKLQASHDAFTNEEGLLYEKLRGLCTDAAWTKSYAASALLMTKELFQEAALELGDTLQPLPACKAPTAEAAARGLRGIAPAGPGATPEGALPLTPAMDKKLGSNLPYVAAMPDFAQRGRARATLKEFEEAARSRMHAHMATSSPLELHALPQARGSDRLPSARASSSRAMSVASEEAGAPATAPKGRVPFPPTPARTQEGPVGAYT